MDTTTKTSTASQPYGIGRTAVGLPRYRVEVRKAGATAWKTFDSRTTVRAADKIAATLAETAENGNADLCGGLVRIWDLVTQEPTSSRPIVPANGWL